MKGTGKGGEGKGGSEREREGREGREREGGEGKGWRGGKGKEGEGPPPPFQIPGSAPESLGPTIGDRGPCYTMTSSSNSSMSNSS